MAEYAKRQEFIIDDSVKRRVDSIVDKLSEAWKTNDALAAISTDDLTLYFNNDEIALIEKVYGIDPKPYGFKGPAVGKESVPDELRRVDPYPYTDSGVPKMTQAQYLPVPVYDAYIALNAAIKATINRPLLIDSSYRSNDYQNILFLSFLRGYGYDLTKTLRRVALPGFSEHNTPSRLALDFITIDGSPNEHDPQDFDKTPEYVWLIEHAHEYGFINSYPKGNPHGIMYEPWHWRFTPMQS